jgi:hypothetical protein
MDRRAGEGIARHRRSAADHDLAVIARTRESAWFARRAEAQRAGRTGKK